MQPSQATKEKLFAYSGNVCAFPGCTAPVVDSDHQVVTAQICHIKGRSPGGPRYDPKQTAAQRASFENLILLCSAHHKIVDDPSTQGAFTVEMLESYKREHERQVHNTVIKTADAQQFIQALAHFLDSQKIISANASRQVTPTVTSDSRVPQREVVSRDLKSKGTYSIHRQSSLNRHWPTPKSCCLAEKLRRIREALGLSQAELLERLDLGESYPRTIISNFETGNRQPPLYILLMYARLVNVDASVLVDDDQDLPKALPVRKTSRHYLRFDGVNPRA